MASTFHRNVSSNSRNNSLGPTIQQPPDHYDGQQMSSSSTTSSTTANSFRTTSTKIIQHDNKRGQVIQYEAPQFLSTNATGVPYSGGPSGTMRIVLSKKPFPIDTNASHKNKKSRFQRLRNPKHLNEQHEKEERINSLHPTIEIWYDIPDGTQQSYHYNPFQPYQGTQRRTYLPNSLVGYRLLTRFKFAFMHGYMFAIGKSITHKLDNQTTFTTIPNKTSLQGGPFGFPDANYISNANQELDRLGIPQANTCLSLLKLLQNAEQDSQSKRSLSPIQSPQTILTTSSYPGKNSTPTTTSLLPTGVFPTNPSQTLQRRVPSPSPVSTPLSITATAPLSYDEDEDAIPFSPSLAPVPSMSPPNLNNASSTNLVVVAAAAAAAPLLAPKDVTTTFNTNNATTNDDTTTTDTSIVLPVVLPVIPPVLFSETNEEVLVYSAPTSLSDPITSYHSDLETVTDFTVLNCPICHDLLLWDDTIATTGTTSVVSIVKLKTCHHMFHSHCLQTHVQRSTNAEHLIKQCPVCQIPFGQYGMCPSGTMKICLNTQCQIQSSTGMTSDAIVLTYTIPSGLQSCFHPQPNIAFDGTIRETYIPNTLEGRCLLQRLKFAWMRGLTFNVGTSMTNRRDNQVLWSTAIPHKTALQGGGPLAYPDDTYIDRCNAALDRMHIPTGPECCRFDNETLG